MKKSRISITALLVLCAVLLTSVLSSCDVMTEIEQQPSSPAATADQSSLSSETSTEEPTEKPTEKPTESQNDEQNEEQKYDPEYPDWIFAGAPEMDESKFVADTTPIGKVTTPESFEYAENGDGTYSIVAAIGDLDAETAIIPSTYDGKPVTKIGGDRALFLDYANLKKIIISDGITHIAASSLSYCKNLQSIVIPDSVKTIEADAFSYSSLRYVNIPEGVTELPYNIFYKCKELRGVKLPSTIKSIGSNAFGGCTSLKTIIIPEGVTEIESMAFWECSKLEILYLPSSLTTFGKDVFDACDGLTQVVIPDGVTTLSEHLFFNCKYLNSIALPASIEKLDKCCLAYCIRLKNIYFLGTVEQWNNIEKVDLWEDGHHGFTVICSDGIA